jgi:hypothetical protein
MSCASPLAFERLVDYFARELDGASESAVEEHLFTCAVCTTAAEAVQSLVSDLARLIPPVISTARLARLRDAGARIHETPVSAGADVDVYFRRDLDLLVHALRAELDGVGRVDMELFVLGAPPMQTEEAVPFDAAAGTVYIACQRHYKDIGFPDDLRFRLVAVDGEARRVLGEYNVRHHWL